MTSGNSNTEHPLRGEYTVIVITYTSQYRNYNDERLSFSTRLILRNQYIKGKQKTCMGRKITIELFCIGAKSRKIIL